MQKDKYQKIIGLTILFGLLFNFPFIGIFNRPNIIFGFPILYLYIFLTWLIFIGLLFWTVEKNK